MCGKLFTSEIRRAGPKDKESVMRILESTQFFREVELKVGEEVFDASAAAGPEGDYQSFVAVDNGKVTGWICFGAAPCTEGTFDIYWIAVAPQWQGRGVGTSLVRFAEMAIGNLNGRMIAADTSASPRYQSTRRFYEKLGYCRQAVIKDFYAVGDDKVIYIKRL